jgi:hypothetical protein
MHQVLAPLRRCLRSRSKNLGTFNLCAQTEPEDLVNCERPVRAQFRGGDIMSSVSSITVPSPRASELLESFTSTPF